MDINHPSHPNMNYTWIFLKKEKKKKPYFFYKPNKTKEVLKHSFSSSFFDETVPNLLSNSTFFHSIKTLEEHQVASSVQSFKKKRSKHESMLAYQQTK